LQLILFFLPANYVQKIEPVYGVSAQDFIDEIFQEELLDKPEKLVTDDKLNSKLLALRKECGPTVCMTRENAEYLRARIMNSCSPKVDEAVARTWHFDVLHALRTNRLECRDCLTEKDKCKKRDPWAPVARVKRRMRE
jgi:hypothetical protein